MKQVLLQLLVANLAVGRVLCIACYYVTAKVQRVLVCVYIYPDSKRGSTPLQHWLCVVLPRDWLA